ncbi:GNAT family N-acetyltransferase [Levilactobacillus andaensis]|uniref:GNAT family N-acetyltransferase n=1 Tax=Levilactobacillus andaensis TaxID=2799570 RepID=UPI0019428C98|nr:GNAT family N-acetyltransferase [Levilactobacillus andaensis]
MPLITRRAPQPDDLDFYHTYRTNAQIALAEGRTPDTSLQATQSHLTALLARISWVILHESQPIGNIAIWGFNVQRTTAELAYGLLPQDQGHGYMATALENRSVCIYQAPFTATRLLHRRNQSAIPTTTGTSRLSVSTLHFRGEPGWHTDQNGRLRPSSS